MATNDATYDNQQAPALTGESSEAWPLQFEDTLAERLAAAYQRQRELIDAARAAAA